MSILTPLWEFIGRSHVMDWWTPEFEALAYYNQQVMKGVSFSPDIVEIMERLQKRYDEAMEKRSSRTCWCGDRH